MQGLAAAALSARRRPARASCWHRAHLRLPADLARHLRLRKFGGIHRELAP